MLNSILPCDGFTYGKIIKALEPFYLRATKFQYPSYEEAIIKALQSNQTFGIIYRDSCRWKEPTSYGIFWFDENGIGQSHSLKWDD